MSLQVSRRRAMMGMMGALAGVALAGSVLAAMPESRARPAAGNPAHWSQHRQQASQVEGVEGIGAPVPQAELPGAVPGMAIGDEGVGEVPPCVPLPPALPSPPPSPATAPPVLQQLVPDSPSVQAAQFPAVGAGGQPALQATFRLCGTADPPIERAIEQLVAGRGFSARLVGRQDGCADLTLNISPQASPGSLSSRQSASLTVSAGSGHPAQRIAVRLVSENGVTHANIGASN